MSDGLLWLKAICIMYDVAIIGSGAAGTTAAMMCLGNGLKTAVFLGDERPTFYPVGGVSHTIHEGVLELANRTGVRQAFEGSIISEFSHVIVRSNSKPSETVNNNWKGYHINKGSLDILFRELLINHHQILTVPEKAYSIQQLGRNYRIQSEKNSINAAFVIDATGRAKWLGKLNKYREKKLSKPNVSFTGLSSSTNRFSQPSFSFTNSGWTWESNDQPHKHTWSKLFISQSSNDNHVKDLEPETYSKNVRGFDTTWRVFRPVANNNILLTGDAGATLDPSSGQGIFNAMISAINAANCISHCLQEPEQSLMHQLSYDNWFYNWINERAKSLSMLYIENGLIV